MKFFLNDMMYDVVNNDTFFKKNLSLIFKKKIDKCYLFQNTNKVHTFFFKDFVDIIGFTDNKIIFKYISVPKNKIVEVLNDKSDTDIIILPKKSCENLKINDSLCFIRE